jgi:hypothetical protein
MDALAKSLQSSEFECVDSRPDLAPPTVEQLTQSFPIFDLF